MDMTKEILIVILEKIKIKNDIITMESKTDIINYMESLDGDATPTPTPTPPDAPGSSAYNDHLKMVQLSSNERLVKWQNHSVSYYDVREWYKMTEKETKSIPNKSGNGFCPFDGEHWDVNSQTGHYGIPNTVPTGSPSKLVCDSHKHLLNKRDQTREIMAWANNNSGILDRKHKTWRVNEFPISLRNRVMMFLENRGDTPEYTPENIQVYNQAAPQAVAPNPLNLQMGQPGVIKCSKCQGLCQAGAQLCPNCGQSPTTAGQKVGSFFEGLAGMGVGIAQAQMLGRVGAGVAQLPKYCPRCSSENLGTAINCMNCGASLASHPPPPQQQGYSNTPQY